MICPTCKQEVPLNKMSNFQMAEEAHRLVWEATDKHRLWVNRGELLAVLHTLSSRLEGECQSHETQESAEA